MLTPHQLELVQHAFRSLDRTGDGVVCLEDICRVFDASKHPHVSHGEMAPSSVRDMLLHQFGESAKTHGGVTLDVFMHFHERMAMEAEHEHIGDRESFLTETIGGLWRMGELLQPTLIRPVVPIDKFPTGIYATQAMSLVWNSPGVSPDTYVVHVIRNVVRPIFSRGDLPPQLRGFFAYPAELAGMKLVEVPTQIAMQRWLDFVWEYAEGKHSGVRGIISSRVDIDTLPQFLRELIMEPDAVKQLPSVFFLPTAMGANPMYKKTSDEYGYGVPEEVKRIHAWKESTYNGTVYGLVYHGRVGKFTAKHEGHMQSMAASAINI